LTREQPPLQDDKTLNSSFHQTISMANKCGGKELPMQESNDDLGQEENGDGSVVDEKKTLLKKRSCTGSITPSCQNQHDGTATSDKKRR
jgi:hypothetical protein